jgi:hypothetical protein
MRAIYVLALIAVGGWATTAAAPVPKEKDQSAYFPAKKGDRWVYEHRPGGRDAPRERVEVTIAVEEKNGAKLVSVGLEFPDGVVPLRALEVSDKGLFEVAHGAGGQSFPRDTPDCLLRLPARAGDEWDGHTGPTTRREKARRSVGGFERVEVPAGTFEAVRVEEESTDRGQPTRATCWYARGAGLVKRVHKRGDLESVVALKSFTPGKD